MTNTPQTAYDADRAAAYEKIIAAAESHAQAVTPMLITNIHVMAPGAARQSAEREAWTLLGKGLRHLQAGAPGGKPGLFTEAVTKASLRNASIASGYNVPAPRFEQGYLNVDFDGGAAEAVFYARRLLEACAADADKSTQMVQMKIATSDAALAFRAPNDIADADLSKIFDAIKSGAPAVPAPQAPDKDALAALRRQAMMTLTFLKDAYAEANKTLTQDIDGIVKTLLANDTPAPKKPSKGKGQSFDF